jgi:Uma2 family endonuclease
MTVAEAQVLARRDTDRFGDGPTPVFQVGTIGWSAKDLEDPELGYLWDQGRYEIIEGVLIVMPPAYFRGGMVTDNLKFLLRSHFAAQGMQATFSGEVHLVVAPSRVFRVDGVVLIGDDIAKFDALRFDPPKTDWRDHPIAVPPTLVIESVSQGHEEHDTVTKRKWYARFGIRHYWIVDGVAGTLECLKLNGDHYVRDAAGKQYDVVEPSSFPGLKIPLREIWET